MELTGEEKKLLALYSELKAADEQTAPHFGRVWNHARKPRRAWALNPAFVAVAAFMFCAAGLLFAWSRYSQPSTTTPSVAKVDALKAGPEKVEVVRTGIASSAAIPTQPKPAGPAQRNTAARRHATQLAATRKLTLEAKAISDWQSPTSTLLSSTSDELFSSLPQLNENASDLKSFLSNRPN